MPWAGGIFSSVKSKSFFVGSQKQGRVGAWQKPLQKSPWPEASLTLVTQALITHRLLSLLLQWAAGILSCCWDAVLGNMSCEVPTLYFWSAVGKIFHLSFAFWTYYTFTGHAPGMEEQPLLNRAALWVGKARGSLRETSAFAVPVHQTIQICHRAWIFIIFYHMPKYSRKRGKKIYNSFFFF